MIVGSGHTQPRVRGPTTNMGGQDGPSLLGIADIALLIISHLDPSTILSIRLVSRQINALILTHQKSLSKSVFSSFFAEPIAWHPPEIDSLPENFHLKILTRLPKAETLARRANKNFDCHIETRTEEDQKVPRLKPLSSYPAFIARCTRAIMILWTLNDIRYHIDPSRPLPTYVSPPPSPPSSCPEMLRRLLTRLTAALSNTASTSPAPVDANALAISHYTTNLQPRPSPDSQIYRSTLSAKRMYFQSLPRGHRTDLIWVLEYLRAGLPRSTRRNRVSDFETFFALHQGPTFLLSWSSSDKEERAWARNLAREVVHTRQNSDDCLPSDWDRVIPWRPGEMEDLFEDAWKAKYELAKDDWRHQPPG